MLGQKISSLAPPVRALELKQNKTLGVDIVPYWYLLPLILVPFWLKFYSEQSYLIKFSKLKTFQQPFGNANAELCRPLGKPLI